MIVINHLEYGKMGSNGEGVPNEDRYWSVLDLLAWMRRSRMVDRNRIVIRGGPSYRTLFLWERLIFVSSTSVVRESWLAQNNSQFLTGSKQISLTSKVSYNLDPPPYVYGFQTNRTTILAEVDPHCGGHGRYWTDWDHSERRPKGPN